MADEEMAAFDRFRDRLGAIERLSERLDERVMGIARGNLGKDDATTLLAFAADGDEKLKGDVVERLNSFRQEVRAAFEHSDKGTASAIYRAVQESENKITAAISALAGTVATMNIANAPPPSDGSKRGWHPAATLTTGAASGASVLYLVLAFLNLVPRPGG